jgi:ABC-type cobalamin/Fe3+-siderophores transport system ATPase subunit
MGHRCGWVGWRCASGGAVAAGGACAGILQDTPLVILDEPTAALDAKAEHELFARIGELFKGVRCCCSGTGSPR